jgi:predicted HicB family RNase H-like nuclease
MGSELMPSNIMRYKEYVAEIRYDDSADAFHGRVVGMRDVIDFYGRTPEELRTEFKATVDDYLAWCAAEGAKPEKTWRGKLTFRPTEEQRRRFILAAAARGLSVNAWALGVLDRDSRIVESETPTVD